MRNLGRTNMSNRPSRLKEKNGGKGIAGSLGFKIGMGLAVTGVIVLVVAGFLTNWTFGLSVAPPVTPTPPSEEVYGIAVFDAGNSSRLNAANVSYYDSDTYGLPDDLVASGNPDNITMQTFDFLALEAYWAKVELSGYHTKWQAINKTGQNDIFIWRLPTTNGTLTILNSSGGAWTNETSDNSTIRVTFPIATQNGTGFEMSFDAENNVTDYITYRFTFNSTPIAGNVNIPTDVESKKVINAGAKTLSVPVTNNFLCGSDVTTNYLEVPAEIELSSGMAMTKIELLYDGIVYGSLTI